jgi:hypothetical protein
MTNIVKEKNQMKRTLALISFATVLAVAAIAQAPAAKTINCQNCCQGQCGQTCCQDGCTDSCCQGK